MSQSPFIVLYHAENNSIAIDASAVELGRDDGEPVHAERYFVATVPFTYPASLAAVVLSSAQ